MIRRPKVWTFILAWIAVGMLLGAIAFGVPWLSGAYRP